jgi:PAS domain S-box-containing protein
MVGYSAAEMCALTFIDITHPDDVDLDRQYAEKLFRREIPWYRLEKRYIRKDGGILPIHLTATVIRSENGAPLYGLAMIEDITERKRAEEELRSREQQLRALLAERERLGQDLHDNIIQTLYAVGLSIEHCRDVLRETSPSAAPTAEAAIANLNQVIRDVRSYIDQTDPNRPSQNDFQEQLTRLIEESKQTRGLDSFYSIDAYAARSLTARQAQDVLLIAREAVSNSLRHSGAKTLVVVLSTRRDGSLRLVVADDGCGFNPEAEMRGHGLRNMRMRAEAIGARLRVLSKPRQATRVVVDIPVEAKHGR